MTDVRDRYESAVHTSGIVDLPDRSSPCSIGKSFVLAPFLLGTVAPPYFIVLRCSMEAS